MNAKKLFVVLAIAMVMFSMALATACATGEVKDLKKNTGVTIDFKKKVSSYKVTWNANGGTIASKKTKVTNVKKGSKVGNLTTPKRTGYIFDGWYSKKSGGTKITKNTKVEKNITYYAQWKKPRVLNSEEKKLVGQWSDFSGLHVWKFYADGSYIKHGAYDYNNIRYKHQIQGFYSIKNGVLTTQYLMKTSTSLEPEWNLIPWQRHTGKEDIEFGTEDGKQFFKLLWTKYYKD